MVAQTEQRKRTRKRIKIFKGETPMEELQQAFTDEMADIMKDAAVRLKVPVEQLKCRVDNMGHVEVQAMDEAEMIERETERIDMNKKRVIRKNRGYNG